MRKWITIDLERIQEWNLEKSEILLFPYLYALPSWSEQLILSGGVWFRISRTKICSDLPCVSTKPDTVYRILKRLEEKELIILMKAGGEEYIQLTEKAQSWNVSKLGKESDNSEERPKNSDERPDTPINNRKEIERDPLTGDSLSESEKLKIRKAAIKVLDRNRDRFQGMSKDLSHEFISWALESGFELEINKWGSVPGIERLVGFFLDARYPVLDEEEDEIQLSPAGEYLSEKFKEWGPRKIKQMLRAIPDGLGNFYAWLAGYIEDEAIPEMRVTDFVNEKQYHDQRDGYERWIINSPYKGNEEDAIRVRIERLKDRRRTEENRSRKKGN